MPARYWRPSRQQRGTTGVTVFRVTVWCRLLIPGTVRCGGEVGKGRRQDSMDGRRYRTQTYIRHEEKTAGKLLRGPSERTECMAETTIHLLHAVNGAKSVSISSYQREYQLQELVSIVCISRLPCPACFVLKISSCYYRPSSYELN